MKKAHACPRATCGSTDLYRRSLNVRTSRARAGWTPAGWVVCFACGATFYRRGQWVRQLETTEQRQARRLRAEAAQAAERLWHA